LPLERSIVAYAGAIARTKGLFDLVTAASALEHEKRPIILLAGAGPETQSLRSEAERCRVDVRFLGQLSQDDVADLFGAADVVTLPSYNEGLPNVVCEAMLSQRAVLATTVGGIPEVIKDNQTGVLVAPASPKELAAGLKHLLGDADERQRMARAARTFAAEHLTWRVSARGYDDLFCEVVSEASSQTALKERVILTN